MNYPCLEDKRVFTRYPIALPISFNNLDIVKKGKACTKNISAVGMCVVLHEEVYPCTPLEVELIIPEHNEQFLAKGQVVWTKQTGAHTYESGVSFNKPEMMSLSRIMHLTKTPFAPCDRQKFRLKFIPRVFNFLYCCKHKIKLFKHHLIKKIFPPTKPT